MCNDEYLEQRAVGLSVSKLVGLARNPAVVRPVDSTRTTFQKHGLS